MYREMILATSGSNNPIKFYTSVGVISTLAGNAKLNVNLNANYGTPVYIKFRAATSASLLPSAIIRINYNPETFEVLTDSSYQSDDNGNTWTLNTTFYFTITNNNVKTNSALSRNDMSYQLIVAYE